MKQKLLERGFTLIELIFVMALLAGVMAMAAPQLSRFVQGRDLREESRRFLALTRYARSEAVSQGIPMSLWIEPVGNRYGLRPLIALGDTRRANILYTLAEGIEFLIEDGALDDEGEATIRFWPDGDIEEGSLDAVALSDRGGFSVSIVKADYGTGYRLAEVDDAR